MFGFQGGGQAIATQMLPFHIGMEVALAVKFSAQRCYEIGLINRVVPDQELMDSAKEMALHICELAPLSVQIVVQACRRARLSSVVPSSIELGSLAGVQLSSPHGRCKKKHSRHLQKRENQCGKVNSSQAGQIKEDIMSKDIPWENLTVGDTFGPVELPYTERYFTCEMEELNPIHTEPSPWGGPVYPAMYMGTLLGLRLIGSRYDSHATVPTRLFQKNINPAGLNKRLFLSGRLVDKYIRNGLEYAAIESVMSDEGGLDIRQTVDHFLLSLERKNRYPGVGRNFGCFQNGRFKKRRGNRTPNKNGLPTCLG